MKELYKRSHNTMFGDFFKLQTDFDNSMMKKLIFDTVSFIFGNKTMLHSPLLRGDSNDNDFFFVVYFMC